MNNYEAPVIHVCLITGWLVRSFARDDMRTRLILFSFSIGLIALPELLPEGVETRVEH